LQDVLAEHRRRIDRFVQNGHTPVWEQSREAALESQRVYFNHPVVQRLMPKLIAIILAMKLLPFVVGLWVGIAHRGIDHPFVWGALLLCAVIGWFLRFLLAPGIPLRGIVAPWELQR
jgi:hypothetical protein